MEFMSMSKDALTATIKFENWALEQDKERSAVLGVAYDELTALVWTLRKKADETGSEQIEEAARILSFKAGDISRDQHELNLAMVDRALLVSRMIDRKMALSGWVMAA